MIKEEFKDNIKKLVHSGVQAIFVDRGVDDLAAELLEEAGILVVARVPHRALHAGCCIFGNTFFLTNHFSGRRAYQNGRHLLSAATQHLYLGQFLISYYMRRRPELFLQFLEVLNGVLIGKERLSRQMPLELEGNISVMVLDDALEPEEVGTSTFTWDNFSFPIICVAVPNCFCSSSRGLRSAVRFNSFAPQCSAKSVSSLWGTLATNAFRAGRKYFRDGFRRCARAGGSREYSALPAT